MAGIDEMILPPVEEAPKPFIECCVVSCSVRLEGDEADVAKAIEAGWRSFAPSHQPPETKIGRTHLGWCPKCAAKYEVTAHYFDPEQQSKPELKDGSREHRKKHKKT